MSYETIIRYIIWFVFFIGLWLLIYPIIMPSVRTIRFNITFKENKVDKYESIVFKYVQNVLAITLNIKTNFGVMTFIFSCLIAGFMVFIALLQSERGIIESFLWAFLTPFVPFIFLHYRLHQLRVKTSYEGEQMATELLNNYQIFHFNIVESIDQTSNNLEHYPTSRKVMSRLALGIKDYNDQHELEDVLNQFNFAINTTWSIQLANIFYNAIYYGDNIKEGLSDILEDLRKLDALNEKNKQTNIEGILMLRLLIPGMIIGTFYVLFSWFGFTLKKYIDYQFRNDLGFTCFFYSVISIIVTLLIYYYMKNPKNDF